MKIEKVELALNKKMDNKDTEGGGKDLCRANWSKEALHMFCDLCIEHAGRSNGKRGVRMSWKILEVDFRRKTNLAYDRNKLKNKWDWMKNKWSLWKALKGTETGLGYDHDKGTISASEEWWNKKIEENMHFRPFRDEGIEPELEIKMDQLFRYCAAQGVHKFIPVMDGSQHVICEKEIVDTPSPPSSLNVGNAPCNCDDEMSENSAFNHGQANMNWQEVATHHSPIPSSTPQQATPLQFIDHGAMGKGVKRVSENDASESNKSCRIEFVRKVDMLMEKLDAMVNVVAKRNIKEIESMNFKARALDDSSHTLVESLAKVVSLPGLIHGSPEFCFACSLIEDPQKRTILHGIPDDNSRLQWIKFLYERDRIV